MLTTLAQVTLKSGRAMTVRLLEPPQDDYAGRLLHFLEHKDNDSLRGIRQRLAGCYAEHCLDRYFVGEVEGELVGQAWYGLSRAGTGVGNFGHVYTEPAWRGEGIATLLCQLLVEHFNAEPRGQCLLCSAGPEAGRIYRKLGFEFIPPSAVSGPLGLVKGESFAAFETRYFAAGQAVQIREGHIGDRHDFDRLLDFSPAWNAARRRWHFVMLAARVPSFISALHSVEDGQGMIRVAEGASGSRVGYAFALALGGAHETHSVFDFVLHPHYLNAAPTLIADTLATAAQPLHAGVAACDELRLSLLLANGFSEVYRFPGAFGLDGQAHDILLLRSD